jgi:hypothetical protein
MPPIKPNYRILLIGGDADGSIISFKPGFPKFESYRFPNMKGKKYYRIYDCISAGRKFDAIFLFEDLL